MDDVETACRQGGATMLGKTFHEIFTLTQSQEHVAAALNCLASGSPIRPVLLTHRPFTEIFAPFARRKNVTEKTHPNLAEFQSLCEAVELFVIYLLKDDNEPPEDERQILAALLLHFLAILPSEERFRTWLENKR